MYNLVKLPLLEQTIYPEDVLKFLDKLPEESIDLVIADPPYNLINAEWDKFPSQKEFLKIMGLLVHPSFVSKKLTKRGGFSWFPPLLLLGSSVSRFRHSRQYMGRKTHQCFLHWFTPRDKIARFNITTLPR